jgi:hypothetical protein
MQKILLTYSEFNRSDTVLNLLPLLCTYEIEGQVFKAAFKRKSVFSIHAHIVSHMDKLKGTYVKLTVKNE